LINFFTVKNALKILAAPSIWLAGGVAQSLRRFDKEQKKVAQSQIDSFTSPAVCEGVFVRVATANWSGEPNSNRIFASRPLGRTCVTRLLMIKLVRGRLY